MHLHLTFPNPLARLTRFLVAIEEARGAETRATDHLSSEMVRSRLPTAACVDYANDLESLSLTCPDKKLEGGDDSLSFLSMTRADDARNGHDGLSDASLTWSSPRRPGR